MGKPAKRHVEPSAGSYNKPQQKLVNMNCVIVKLFPIAEGSMLESNVTFIMMSGIQVVRNMFPTCSSRWKAPLEMFFFLNSYFSFRGIITFRQHEVIELLL